MVDAFGDKVLETVITRTVKFPDATVAATPITEFAPEHQAACHYPLERWPMTGARSS